MGEHSELNTYRGVVDLLGFMGRSFLPLVESGTCEYDVTASSKPVTGMGRGSTGFAASIASRSKSFNAGGGSKVGSGIATGMSFGSDAGRTLSDDDVEELDSTGGDSAVPGNDDDAVAVGEISSRGSSGSREGPSESVKCSSMPKLLSFGVWGSDARGEDEKTAFDADGMLLAAEISEHELDTTVKFRTMD